MHQVVDVVLPVFGLIGVGAIAAWRGWLDEGVTDALNRYVVWLALPALLFHGAARMTWADVDHPGFIAAAVGGMMATFVLALAIDGAHRRLADRVIEALAASYANNGYLGIPLALGLFGAAILPALVISILSTAVLLFGIAIVLIELDLAAEPGRGATLRKAGGALARNPLLVAPLAGCLWASSGRALPAPLERLSGLLGDSAGPCALVTIGLFLVQRRDWAIGRDVLRLSALKLFAQPAFTFAITLVAPMSREWLGTALLLAALPTGTGPFMLAKLYEREAATTSRTILVSTLLSVATVSALIVWIGR